MSAYKDFPKGDARRYFTVLLAAHDLGEKATLHYISQRVECTRAEAQRALESAVDQFGVDIRKDGPVYSIVSWGVLNQDAVRTLVVTK
ncbi:hypothetical protein G3N57_00650 [Paraburkholderia sp. Se-20369]|nr:hypothetical protein [Paraburkholderia sp. Se-20369]